MAVIVTVSAIADQNEIVHSFIHLLLSASSPNFGNVLQIWNHWADPRPGDPLLWEHTKKLIQNQGPRYLL